MADPEDERVRRLIQQLLESDRVRESAAFSERTYSGEPILRTGADLLRERREREDRQRQAEERRRQRAEARKAPRPRSAASAAAWKQPASWDSGYDGYNSLVDQLVPEPKLPPELEQLRALENSRDEQGLPLRGAELFVRQARLAEGFEPEGSDVSISTYHYYPSYQDLTDRELLSYFCWRTQWRRGEARELPFGCGRILAAELVNGIGAEQGEPVLRELLRLRAACTELDAQGMGPNLETDLAQWARDYAVYFGLDASQVVSEDERTYASAVATLRLAERDVLARQGLHGLKPEDAPAESPTDDAVFHALGDISTYQLARSPFFREQPEEAARVTAEVFRQLAIHCAKRRKTLFVDGIVGYEETRAYTPFLGLPFLEEGEHEDVTVRLTACETVSYRFGRWRVKRGYERRGRNRDVTRILRGIDRQMRADWGFKRPLKEVGLPKYLQRMIEKASAAEHEHFEEAERRKITIDLSQLGHIRAAAATTREALLVDEEREDYVPPEPEPEQPEQPEQEPEEPAESGDLGLTDLERSLLHRLLDGKPCDDLFGPGKPAPSLVVDSINEKLFDEIGDTVVEFDESERPHLVEDYVDDLRELGI